MRSTLTVYSTLVFVFALLTPANGQSVFQVSKKFDSTDAPSTRSFPGFNGAFRQQILIASDRVKNLAGQSLKGIWVRRDLARLDHLKGGDVDLEIKISLASVPPSQAKQDFSLNSQVPPILVFKGRIVVPNAPKLGGPSAAWSIDNAVKVLFTTSYPFPGGDLCIDVSGRPVPNLEPEMWFIDYELGQYSGSSRTFGKSCSRFADVKGETLHAYDNLLQIGSTMRLINLGRPGTSPILLLGTGQIIGGIDLSGIGAKDCFQHISFFTLARLRYSNPLRPQTAASLHFDAQIPPDTNLLGVSVFAQIADDERTLPAATWTNRAGLTTSNGLEIRISSLKPDLNMSIVTSRLVYSNAPMPTSGQVNVSTGPVLRILY